MPQNDKYDWLTYETVFQQQRFARTNEKLDIGLYSIKREEVTVFFRSEISDELLTSLTDAFFPDAANAKAHKIESDQTWPWKQQATAAVAVPVSPVGVTLAASPAVVRLFLDQWVVLPYNHLDNDANSRALGTAETPQVKRLNKDKKWEFWKTASRSCVMRTSRVKDQPAPWTDVHKPWEKWTFADGDTMRRDFRIPAGPPANGYKLALRTPADFSVKTGVIYVGIENQKNAEKDNLDSNWIIACLRSDHVAAIDKKMGRDPATDDLVVLTELLSINEKSTRGEGNLDGVQVRDLSPLKKGCLYIPPLSIPVIDKDFQTRSSEFINLTDKEWCDFWKRSWAVALGKAKALFLLRYGLQHLNPNVQNYLIEFNPAVPTPRPTGRIIIRDLQDASLHREVTWALFGPGGPPPTDKTALTGLTSELLKHEFSPALIKESQETGSVDSKFGPPGLQFLWKRFSMFGGNNKDEEFIARMFREGNRETFQKIAAAEMSELSAPESVVTANTNTELGKIANADERDRCGQYLAKRNDFTHQFSLLYPDKSVSDILELDVGPALQRHFPRMNMVERRKFKGIAETIDEASKNEIALIKKVRTDVIAKTRKLLLAVMADWGRVHNLAYIHSAERMLGVNFGIDWSLLPDPSRHLRDEKINGDSELKWEEDTAKILHNYLASDEGQNKVRAYRDRGWQPAARVFGLQFLDGNSIPMEINPVKMVRGAPSKKWIDLTDREGYIHVYEADPNEYHFEIVAFPDLAGGSFSVSDLINKASGPILDFGYIKIKYVAG